MTHDQKNRGLVASCVSELVTKPLFFNYRARVDACRQLARYVTEDQDCRTSTHPLQRKYLMTYRVKYLGIYFLEGFAVF